MSDERVRCQCYVLEDVIILYCVSASCSINVLSCVVVTIEKVWIGSQIYWTHSSHNYKQQ
jgi:hypothetical protein